MNVISVIWVVIFPVVLLYQDALAIEVVKLGGMKNVELGGMKNVEMGGMANVELGGMAPVGMQEAKPRAGEKSAINNNALSQDMLRRGCKHFGENIYCPGVGMRQYADWTELPQLGRIYNLTSGGGASTTDYYENNVRINTVYSPVNLRMRVQIAPDGKYAWQMRDGKVVRGKWIRKDATTLILLNANEGKNWDAYTQKRGVNDETNKGSLILQVPGDYYYLSGN